MSDIILLMEQLLVLGISFISDISNVVVPLDFLVELRHLHLLRAQVELTPYIILWRVLYALLEISVCRRILLYRFHVPMVPMLYYFIFCSFRIYS